MTKQHAWSNHVFIVFNKKHALIGTYSLYENAKKEADSYTGSYVVTSMIKDMGAF